MKRYNCYYCIDMEEHPDGKWVLHEDVLSIQNQAFRDGGESAKAERKSVECNCVDEATDRKVMKSWPLADLSWMCPKHGYKRL